jgi:hypothetical protein
VLSMARVERTDEILRAKKKETGSLKYQAGQVTVGEIK